MAKAFGLERIGEHATNRLKNCMFLSDLVVITNKLENYNKTEHKFALVHAFSSNVNFFNFFPRSFSALFNYVCVWLCRNYKILEFSKLWLVDGMSALISILGYDELKICVQNKTSANGAM